MHERISCTKLRPLRRVLPISLSAAARQGNAGYGAAPLEQPVVFDFDAGLPDPATYPLADLVQLSERVLRADPGGALHYGRDEILYGYDGLRSLLASRGGIEPDQIMLTSGGAQAISLACQALADPGDVLAVEIPTWGYLMREASLSGVEIAAIPTDADGIRVDLLARELDAGLRIRALYVIPNFSVPTGACMSLERRHQLVALAARARFAIIEDNTYGELRYDGDHLPSLFELDTAGLVVKIDSFSKTIAPGLRLGWASGHPAVIAGMAAVRRDLGVSQWISRVIEAFVAEGTYDTHLACVKDIYRSKRDVAQRALGEHLGARATWRRPDGGFFYWLEFTGDIDAASVMAHAAARGVRCRPGERFYGDPSEGRQRVRLAFSMYDAASLETGIRVLGESLTAT